MLVLTQAEVTPCGVVRSPGSKAERGVRHQQRFYVLDRFLALDLTAAIDQCRIRLDRPQVAGEAFILLEGSLGYWFCLYQPQMAEVGHTEVLQVLCEQMRVSSQLVVEDRRWGLRQFKKCFVGSEAVTWLVSHLHLTRSEALQIGQQCLDAGLFSHVLGEQGLVDDFFFYRFNQDGNVDKRVVSSPSAHPKA